MPTIAALAERYATVPPRGRLSDAEMRVINEQWGQPLARVASGFQTLLTAQTSEIVNTALRGLGGVAIPPGIIEQASTAINQLATGQVSAATHAAEALNAINTAALRDATNMFALTGSLAATAAAKQAIGIVSAVERMPLPFDSMADSLTRAVANAAWADVPRPVSLPYLSPALHIRRVPLPMPREEEPPLILSERRSRTRGRPRHSYRYAPEFVVRTYQRLAASGSYVTQEQLAEALGVEPRTIQNWITSEHMGLGWPPKL